MNDYDRVIPGLYIGSFDARHAGIWDVVISMTRSEKIPGVVHKVVDIDDSPDANILKYLDTLVDFIHLHRSNEKRVLVHCMAGISRSATVVIAYLMKYKRMTLDNAYEFLQMRRSWIQPNAGFEYQLKKYERYLVKRR